LQLVVVLSRIQELEFLNGVNIAGRAEQSVPHQILLFLSILLAMMMPKENNIPVQTLLAEKTQNPV